MATIGQAASTLEVLTPLQLHNACKERKPDNSHEPFCFEIFRRAIVEKSEYCWSLVYQQYERLVYDWISEVSYDAYDLGNETQHALVTTVFATFWRAFDGEKLAKAVSLAHILAYLKSCAVTTALQARRTQRKQKLDIEFDDAKIKEFSSESRNPAYVSQIVEETEFAQRLWKTVESVCRDDRERKIVWLSFVSDCTPEKIQTIHPGLFVDSKEISEIRRSLKNRLLRNHELRTLLEE